MNIRFLYCLRVSGRNRFFLEGDKGGGSGGDGGAAAPRTLAEAKERLTEKEGKVTEAEARATKAERERDDAKAEVTKLQGQFNSATEAATSAQRERDEARTERDAARQEVTKITGERDQAKKELATEKGNVARLEQLCGVKGVDPNAAVTTLTDGPSSKEEKIQTLRDQLAKCKDPKEKAKLSRQIRKLQEDKENKEV